VELADLVDHFPAQYGRIVRVLVSAPDWEPAPRRIRITGGHVQVGPIPRNDPHVIRLETSDRAMLRVLVVPPGFTRDQGSEALLAAATAGHAHSAQSLLDEVTDHPGVDPRDHWSDAGGSWWGPDLRAPSFRTGR
jgi:hypothetical protein